MRKAEQKVTGVALSFSKNCGFSLIVYIYYVYTISYFVIVFFNRSRPHWRRASNWSEFITAVKKKKLKLKLKRWHMNINSRGWNQMS